MRFDYFLLVVTATLLASANAALGATTNSKLATVPDFHVTETFAAGTVGTATKRFLRTKTTTIEVEERGPLFTNALTKLRNFFKIGDASKVSKQAETVVTKLTPQRELSKEMLEKQQTFLDDAFVELKLNEVTQKNLFKKNEFQEWVARRQEFNKMHNIEDEPGFQIISKYFKNDDILLSKWIDEAKRNPKLEEMADYMRSGQISNLFAAGRHPDDIYIILNVRGMKKTAGLVNENWHLYKLYLKTYSTFWGSKQVQPPLLKHASIK